MMAKQSLNDEITLGIIIVCRNNSAELTETLNSIFNIKWGISISLYIIDGSDNDYCLKTTIAFKERFSEDIKIYSLHELDTGIYNAMNKGLGMANTDFAIFINSGDYIYSQINIESLISTLKVNTTKIILAGHIIRNGERQYIKTEDEWIEIDNSKKNEKLLIPLTCHQAILYPQIYYKSTLYSETQGIYADMDFTAKGIQAHGYIRHSGIISVFNIGGASTIGIKIKDLLNNTKNFQESRRKSLTKLQILIKYIRIVTKNFAIRALGISSYYDLTFSIKSNIFTRVDKPNMHSNAGQIDE